MLTGLTDAASQGKSEYSVRPLAVSTRKFAAFAYVAGQLGYQYAGHTPGTGAGNNPFFSFRRTADADRLTAATTAEYPNMLHGGPLPGMQPGKGLRPLPETEGAVELLRSQMVLDACARYSRRVLGNLLLVLVGMVVFLAFRGFTAEWVLVAGGAWLGLFALYLVGLAVTRRRWATHLERLGRAGVQWPPPHADAAQP
jgi:hypothetical protein